jgi:hypothetical protein
LRGAEHGYGQAQPPEDYLAAFADFIRGHRNQIPTLVTVLTRRRDLSRQQLREIALELDKANLIVDRAALDDPDLIFKREGGRFPRLDRLFCGELVQVLDGFNDALWQQPAA